MQARLALLAPKHLCLQSLLNISGHTLGMCALATFLIAENSDVDADR